MTIRDNVEVITFSTDARQMLSVEDSGGLILLKNVNSDADSYREIIVPSGAALGGGTLSVEASYHEEPNTATDAEWTSIHPDLDSLTAGRIYPIRCKATRLALKLSGATDPDFEVYIV